MIGNGFLFIFGRRNRARGCALCTGKVLAYHQFPISNTLNYTATRPDVSIDADSSYMLRECIFITTLNDKSEEKSQLQV
jgi:hypothetical protein